MSEGQEWSVVVTGFGGNEPEDDAALRRFLGNLPDLFRFSPFELMVLVTRRQDWLPAEVANGLSQAEADQVVRRLAEHSIAASATETDGLPAVRYRLKDLLPDYVDEAFNDGEGLVLSKVDGLIVSSTPVMAKAVIGEDRADPDMARWQTEDYFNHVHYGGMDDSLEESVRQGRELMDRLEAALRQTYPDLSFTLMLEPRVSVSFWQTRPDSPREAEERRELVFIDPVSHPC